MLLHLFEMQDRNSAWTALCMKPRSDELHDARPSLSSLPSYNSSPLHRPDSMGAHASLDFVHKHPELESPASEHQNRQLAAGLSRLCQAQSTSNGRTKSDNPPAGRHQDIASIFSFNASQETRSEPTTRSSSLECEKDQIDDSLSAADLISRNRDLDMSIVPDLTVPPCK